MKKSNRKKVAGVVAVCMFAVMMMFSVTTSKNGTDVSLNGIEALASGSSTDCYECNVPRTDACVIINGHTVKGVKKDVECDN